MPAVRRQALSGLLAQVSQGAAAVGIILVVHAHTGSLALAGAVVGALSIAAGVSRPLQGMLIDRRGSAGVMAICGIVHPLGLIGIVAVSQAAALIALGIVAGIALPPVSTCMRVAWARLIAAENRTAAYSLVYLVQELAILTGPLLLAAVIAAASASAALVVVAVVSGIGTLGFAASVAGGGAGHVHGARFSVIRTRAVQLLLIVVALVGVVIGALEVGIPILATEHGAPAASGLLIAALSVGGIGGAAIYGSRQWRARPFPRLLALLAAFTAFLVPLIAATGLVLVGALLLFAGLALNPTLTTFSLLIDELVHAGRAAEAFGWLSTAIAGGTGAGSAIAAAIAAGHHDARPAFTVAVIAAAAALASAWAARKVLG